MRDTFSPTLSDHQCPLCMGENGCAISRGDDPAQCWCMSTAILPQQRYRASKLGYELNCLCKSCGTENAEINAVQHWDTDAQAANQ